MKTLPDGLIPIHRTPEFSETSLPDGLKKQHRTKAGIWAKIIVLGRQASIPHPRATAGNNRPVAGAPWGGGTYSPA